MDGAALQSASMDWLGDWLGGIPHEWKALGAIVAVCFVAVMAARLTGNRLARAYWRNRERPLPLDQYKHLQWQRQRRASRSWQRIFIRNPLWLVIFAVALGVAWLDIERFGIRDAETITGRVSHVRDGDTIEVDGLPIRFQKLDCAELGTAQGETAKTAMRNLALRQPVTCVLTGERSYDRVIGSCALQDGTDLAQWMRREGYCSRWW